MRRIAMNCSCIEGSNSYDRLLSSSSSSSEISLATSLGTDDISDVTQAEIDFYNEDGSFKRILVEENLRAGDLCQLLALKNHVAKDVNWAVIEYLDELGLERCLEDHEDVFKAYVKWKLSTRSHGNKFLFRKDFRKFEIITNPSQFFPLDMIDCESKNDFLCESDEVARMINLQTVLNAKDGDETPKIYGHLWIQESFQQLWEKAAFVLSQKTLYYSFTSNVKDPSKMLLCANLQDYDVYTLSKTNKYFKVPTEYCFCLKLQDQFGQVDAKQMLFFAGDTERIRTCWITGFRLAKFGKQIRDNFRSFKSRLSECANSNNKEYSSCKVSNDSLRTRVAMDFTNVYGRIIEDPKEAEAIEAAEGYDWSKKLRPTYKRLTVNSLRGLESGIHITQPWFHSGLSREEAIQLLTKYGTVNGVFLMRESHTIPGAFVLSFMFNEKIFHTQIFPMEDNNQIVYSLDNGKTKFYDVLQLVEFYQLNAACLPTRLTHHIVQTKDMFKV